MKELFFVFVGGGVGSSLRFIVSMIWRHMTLNPRWASTVIPWPTFIVNIVGCFLIGLFYQHSERWGLAPETRLMLTTGLCGGLTTFSTFSYEGITLLRSGYVAEYAIYTVLSIVLGILAVLLAIKI